MNESLIAPCGMNCAVCSRHLALKHDIRSKGINMSYCTGCRARNKQCAYLKKSCRWLLNGEVQYCYQCPDFPCQHLQTFDKRYRTFYKMSPIGNLEYIRDKGIAEFLKAETEKWRCPGCGGVGCCHNGILTKIGGDCWQICWQAA